MSDSLASLAHTNRPTDTTDSLPALSSITSLKRRASESFECMDEISRKRIKEAMEAYPPEDNTVESSFQDQLAEELQCGCCSELVYRPVLVMPCQHFFCGSCCVLWIRNGGTNCPACRGVATIAMPFRALQLVIDSLLRHAPHKARAEREREQADEVYKLNHSIRIPPPREVSPPLDLNRSTEYVHPCPHCGPNNPYEWRCPQPISDPSTDPDHAWHIDDGVPPGHASCGNCENLLALRAPTTTRCDLCLVSFCGIGVQDRCMALPILSQHPHNLSTMPDLIQSSDVYECFDGNTVEVDIMLEYLETQRLTPRHIYREIIQDLQKLPQGFAKLMELELFNEIHGVPAGIEPNPEAPRNRACRLCAAEILLWGLKDWWIKERAKGFLEESITKRKDCPEFNQCTRQKDDPAHAREFNHIFLIREITPDPPETGIPTAPPPPPAEVPQASPHLRASPPFEPPNPLPPIPASLSFLLNDVEDHAHALPVVPPPPELLSSAPDIQEPINMQV